jgi:1,4-dihydroxy-2-naphthoate octaprenyltransferase
MRILKLFRPLNLVLAALTYTLGAGMARYLGARLAFAPFVLGLAFSLLSLIAAHLLTEYFRPREEPLVADETPEQRERLRIILFQVSVAALGGAALLFVPLWFDGLIALPVAIFLALIGVAALAYAIPPARLVYSGLGELTLSVLLGAFIPSLAFLLQMREPHRLLAMFTFPLVFLCLAFLLILDFPSFALDQKYRRATLLIRLSWQNAVPLHHGLLLVAYLLFAIALTLGFPFALVWPAFLTLPLAVVQIVWLNRIADGAPPVWKFLTALAASVFGLTAYFLTLTFWLR